MSPIATLSTMMLSYIERFSYRCIAIRAGLGGAVGIDAHGERATLPAHPFKQIEKLTKRSINTILAKHPPIEANRVQNRWLSREWEHREPTLQTESKPLHTIAFHELWTKPALASR